MPPDPPNLLICSVFLALAAAGPANANVWSRLCQQFPDVAAYREPQKYFWQYLMVNTFTGSETHPSSLTVVHYTTYHNSDTWVAT